MVGLVINAIFSFLSAGFKNAQGAIAYSFGTPERRKWSALAIVYLTGFLIIDRWTYGWDWWILTALVDTAFVLVITAIELWITGDHPTSIIFNPSTSPK